MTSDSAGWWEDLVRVDVDVGGCRRITPMSVGCYGEKSNRGDVCSVQNQTCDFTPTQTGRWNTAKTMEEKISALLRAQACSDRL